MSASLLILEPTTLHIAIVLDFFSFASLNAARVSAVSPDCEINIVKTFSSITGLAYLNSEAIFTSVGIPVKFSNKKA